MKNVILKNDIHKNNSSKNKNRLLLESMEMDRDEIGHKIICLRNGIKMLTSEKFLKDTFDLDEVPEFLNDLINGSEKMNFDKDFLLYKQGRYDGNKLMCDTQEIFHEVLREIDEIIEVFVYGKIIEKECNYYERT